MGVTRFLYRAAGALACVALAGIAARAIAPVGAAFAALLADGEPDDLAEFERFATSPRFRISGIDPEELKEAKAAYGDQHAAGGGKKRAWPALTKSGEREYALLSASTRTLRKAAKGNGATVHEFLLAATAQNLRKLAKLIPPPVPVIA